jgi:adenine phosphoribosyltransferase
MPSGEDRVTADNIELFVVPVKDRARGLLAHELDGRFRPMDPRLLHEVVQRLVAQVDISGIDHVLGIPEGGAMVALEFARIVGLPLVLSSRMRADMPGAIYFEEPHSVTADRHNFVYGLKPGDHVVIVDDEINTGRTLVNAAQALRAAGVLVDRIVVLLASAEAQTLARIDDAGLTLTSAFTVPIEVGRAVAGTASDS